MPFKQAAVAEELVARSGSSPKKMTGKWHLLPTRKGCGLVVDSAFVLLRDRNPRATSMARELAGRRACIHVEPLDQPMKLLHYIPP